MPILSEKQCRAIKESTARINIWQGAVRSGKTYSSLLRFIQLLRKGPPGNVMIIGVTRESIQRNILTELCNILGTRIPGSKTTEMTLLGRQVYMVGANDESAVRRIQGSTLALAYVDEVAEIPQPFWQMLLSRISVPGAQILATCNPSGPAHWLKRDYLDRKDDLDLRTWTFLLDDNPALDPAYVANLKKEYSGMWYRRYILGEWAVAHGLIYDRFDDMNVWRGLVPNATFYAVGMDYGSSNPTAAVLAAVRPKEWPQLTIVSEYYFDGRKSTQGKTDAELADDIESWLKPYNIQAILLDPSAKSMRLELGRRNLPVREADNDVQDGIQTVARLIANKSLVVTPGCSTLIDELRTYSWDPKAADKGEDRPLKVNDHCVDGLRYLCHSMFPGADFGALSKEYTIDAIRRRAYGEANPNADMFGFDSGYM